MNETTRTKHHRARRSGVGTGTTSLLMIFTVLCFATLAMLSLSTAASNDRIQERGLSGSRALAEARGLAAIEVAELDELLLQLQGSSAYVQDALDAAESRRWEVDRAAGTATLRQAVGNEHQLVTTLQMLEAGENARYEVLAQVTELVNGWTPEQDGQVWQPSFA